MEPTALPIVISPEGLGLLLTRTGIIAVCALHPQIDAPLAQTLAGLANAGERIAVIVADNHFEAQEIARRVRNKEHLRVARGETPHQVRHLVQRVQAAGGAYSIVVVIGLLEPFYDEQVRWTVAQHLLTDTLRVLQELSNTLRVLVVITPPPNETRPYLQEQIVTLVDYYLEIPELPAPSEQAPRLF
jgi:uncharacterized protein YgbK (DUF1537 family)